LLKIQTGNDFDNCPEPNEPPTDNQICNKHQKQVNQCIVPSRVYNQQIIKNQFPKPFAINPFGNAKCINCISDTSTITSVSNLHPPSGFNPNMWAIPPNHQIVITPAQTPILNQTQTSVNVAYNAMDDQPVIQHNSPLLPSCFQNAHHSTFANRNLRFPLGNSNQSPRFYRGKYQHRNYYPRNSFPNKWPSNKPNKDLRQMLHSKRNFNASKFQENYCQGNL
jgi:hypothetical protein